MANQNLLNAQMALLCHSENAVRLPLAAFLRKLTGGSAGDFRRYLCAENRVSKPTHKRQRVPSCRVS